MTISSRAQQLELPVAPERAQLLLARLGRAVAAAGRRAARIAARDRGAVEGRVELLLAELEPLAELCGPRRRATAGARWPSSGPGAWP